MTFEDYEIPNLYIEKDNENIKNLKNEEEMVDEIVEKTEIYFENENIRRNNRQKLTVILTALIITSILVVLIYVIFK